MGRLGDWSRCPASCCLPLPLSPPYPALSPAPWGWVLSPVVCALEPGPCSASPPCAPGRARVQVGKVMSGCTCPAASWGRAQQWPSHPGLAGLQHVWWAAGRRSQLKEGRTSCPPLIHLPSTEVAVPGVTHLPWAGDTTHISPHGKGRSPKACPKPGNNVLVHQPVEGGIPTAIRPEKAHRAGLLGACEALKYP